MKSFKEKFLWMGGFAALSVIRLSNTAFAMAARPNPDPNAPPPPAWVQWAPILVMIAVFYFLLFRPQMRQKKEKENLLSSLKKGDRIVTAGGLIGMIVNVGQDIVEIKLNEETKVKLRRSGVAEVLPANEPEPVVTNS